MHVNNFIWQTSPLIFHTPGLQHSREKDFIHMFLRKDLNN
jgi:hypothetical protein